MSITVLTPPQSINKISLFDNSIFLAGTIDNGYSANWQVLASNLIDKEMKETKKENKKVLIFNPRRDSWNNTWVNRIHNAEFYQQINWELDCIEKCSHLLFHIEEDSKSPITLMEIGLSIKLDKPIFISCSPKFYRYGNIEVVCHKYGIPLFDDLPTAIKNLVKNV